MKLLRVLSTAILALLPVHADDALCPPKASFHQDTAAVVDGRPIRLAEVDDRMREQIFDYESRLYSARLAELNSLIDQILFRRDAEQRGLSPDEYHIVLTNAHPVTASEVDALYLQIRSRLRGLPPADAKKQVQRDLTEIKKRQVYDETIRQLRAKADISILLGPPLRPTVAVALNGMEPTLGPPIAKITIVEFSDFQCPYCKKIQDSLATVLAANPGAVRLIFKNLPLPSHGAAHIAAEAGFCAEQQKVFWHYKDRVFAMAPAIEHETVLAVARAVAPDAAAFDNCITAAATKHHIEADIAEARRLGIQATPTLVINGKVLRGMVTAEALQQVVLKEQSLPNQNSRPPGG